MSESGVQSKILKKDQCMGSQCVDKKRKYYCQNHSLSICPDCRYDLHHRCQVFEEGDLQQLARNAKREEELLLKHYLYAKRWDMEDLHPGINAQITHYRQKIIEIKEEISAAIKEDQRHISFPILEPKLQKLRIDIEDSPTMSKILYYNSILTQKCSFAPGQEDPDTLKRQKEAVDKAMRTYAAELEAKYQEKEQNMLAKCREEAETEQKEVMEGLQAQLTAETEAKEVALLQNQQQITKIEQLEEEKSHLAQEKVSLEGEREHLQAVSESLKKEKEDLEGKVDHAEAEKRQLEGQVEECKTKIRSIEDKLDKAEEENKEFHMKEEALKIGAIYNSAYGKEITLDKTTTLKLSCTDSKDSLFMKEMVEAKARLPPIKRLWLGHTLDGNDVLKKFLKHCVPTQLEYLCLNYSYSCNSDKSNSLSISKISEELALATKAVTHEVYIRYANLTSKSLGTLVQNCTQAERLIIRFSKINTCSSLCFTSPLPHSLKYLSFNNCDYKGSWTYSNWAANPSVLDNIVSAVKKSSLAHTLHTLNVQSCSISDGQVKQLLKDQGLTNVSVLRENNYPIEG